MKITKRITPIGLEKQLFGEEVLWDESQDKLTDEEVQSRLIRVFNFYNYQCNDKNARTYVEEFLKLRNEPKNTFDVLGYVPDSSIFGAFSWLARMQVMGFKLRKPQKLYFNDKLKKLIELGTAKRSIKKEVVAKQPIVDIQQRVDEAIGLVISELDYQIDEFIAGKFQTKFSPYDWMKTNNLKPLYAKRIVESFSSQQMELEEAYRGKDEQLNEGYSNFKKPQLIKLCKFVELIVTDAELWLNNAKKTKAPRKTKTKSSDQIVKNVRYQKNEEQLRLTSINPVKIVGANEVWLFNSKSRAIQKCVADGPSGLTVKGTTIKGFNEENSVCKKIRKPEEIAQNIVNATSKGATKYFSGLKTKESKCNGRINDMTLILRIN